MAINFTPTLKGVLRELQALRARIDQQIKVMQSVIRTSTVRQKEGPTKHDKSPSFRYGRLRPRSPCPDA